MAKPLTKSRFKIALECPTRLHYENARDMQGKPLYFSQLRDNAFVAALADGGHQVGALAKFKFHPDPMGRTITVEASDYEEAVTDTQRRLAEPGRVVIAEAALRHDTYFVRVDLLIRDPQRLTVEIIEVKSKGVTRQDIANRLKGSGWRPYLYDVAFQAEVASLAFPGWRIVPKLLLLDKSVPCDVGGLQQHFPVIVDTTGRNARVDCPPSLRREDLGSLDILVEVDVTNIVADLRASPVPAPHSPPHHTANLRAFMQWTAHLQQSGERHFGGVSKACKGCAYRAPAGDPARSGLHECLEQAVREGQLEGTVGPIDRRLPLALDLWGLHPGKPGMPERVMRARRVLLSDVQEADIAPANPSRDVGFTPFERRMAQIRASRETVTRPELREARLADMDLWEWPLHMIDFETAVPPVPYFQGTRPHEMLAFQFSHHVMDRDDQGRVNVRHSSQWLSAEPGIFPNFDFVRQLRQALMPDGVLRGTVLRYHQHENTVLVKLRHAIVSANLPDGDELVDFIDRVTDPGKGAPPGPQAMVDLHALVQEGYYTPHAGGSVSLKAILPAIVQDSPMLRALYARPGLYGLGLAIPSLNFNSAQGHIWLRADDDWNPYLTLPPVFAPGIEPLQAMSLRLGGEDEEDGAISQGGAAMTAYSHLQSAHLPPRHREEIRNALLRYCELDTLAMVMLVQGLMELRGRPLELALLA